MIEYLKNIIPRIKQYSKELDKEENFVNKNWIYIDFNNSQHEYIFLRDKRLIMTLNSVTKEGSWELLPTGQLLIKRSSTDLVKLENIFVENALLILKQSATADTPFVLINQQIIPDLNVIAYLKKYEQEKQTIPLPKQNFKLLANGELSGPEFYEGKIIKTDDNIILRGAYKIFHHKTTYEQYVVIYENRITSIFFKVPYSYNSTKIILEQSCFNLPSVGDKIIDSPLIIIPIYKIIKIENNSHEKLTIVVNADKKIILSLDNQSILILIIFIVITLIILLINLILSK